MRLSLFSICVQKYVLSHDNLFSLGYITALIELLFILGAAYLYVGSIISRCSGNEQSSDNCKERLLLGVVGEAHFFLIGKMTIL